MNLRFSLFLALLVATSFNPNLIQVARSDVFLDPLIVEGEEITLSCHRDSASAVMTGDGPVSVDAGTPIMICPDKEIDSMEHCSAQASGENHTQWVNRVCKEANKLKTTKDCPTTDGACMFCSTTGFEAGKCKFKSGPNQVPSCGAGVYKAGPPPVICQTMKFTCSYNCKKI